MTLDAWHNSGLLNREKLLYEEYLNLKIYDGIYWFTYGTKDTEIAYELQKRSLLHNKIKVFGKPNYLPGKIGNWIFSFVAPIILYRWVNECSIIKSNQADGAWACLISKLIFRKPFLFRTGFSWSSFATHQRSRRIRRLIEKVLFFSCDISTVSSEGDLRNAIKIYNAKRIRKNFNYIDINKFHPKSLTRKKRLLYVGRLSNQKNLLSLIRSLKGLDIGLDIVGDGELKEKLVSEAQQQEADITFLGTLNNEDLPSIYNQYSFFVLPSYYEGMPKSLIEAMACGCLCIGCHVPGVKELLNSDTGIVSSSTSTVDIRKALLVAINENHTQKITNAVNFIQNNFGIKAYLDREVHACKEFTSIMSRTIMESS